MLFAVAAVVMLAACNHGDTYADQKNRERSAINKFIKENGINVISESDFEEQNNVTYLKATNMAEMLQAVDTLLYIESDHPVLLEVFVD